METHVHYYFLNLLVFDLLASVGKHFTEILVTNAVLNKSPGGLLNIKWAMTAVSLPSVAVRLH
jgi:hypothetical protein